MPQPHLPYLYLPEARTAYGLSAALSFVSPYCLSLGYLLQPAPAVLLLCAPLAFLSPIAFFTQLSPLTGLLYSGFMSFLVSRATVPELASICASSHLLH